MANIHLVGGEKGGVGKSVVARILAQYMIDHQMPFAAFDTDRSHGSLLRFYADYAVATEIDAFESLDAIIEAAIADRDRHILVDLAAQTFHPFVKWLEESGVLELTAEWGLSITYWNIMDSGKDSVDLLGPLFDNYHPNINYVLVLNHLRGEDFTIFNQSDEKDRALAFGAKIINLKRLHPPVMNKIDAMSASFWACQNTTGDEALKLGLLERQRTKIWLRHAYEEITSIGI
ncbi:MAG: mobilization protein [Gammaproteobacteria bacterium]|nr:mobilization protein [Gammaproteobacteria bacterium]